MSAAVLPPPVRDSLFHRMRYTPLRDVLRGHWTARLDIAGRIAAAGLPATASDVIDQVVRATRLRRIEKADVADELIAHFRDGLEAGVPADALRTRFGDVRCAARLIRRAKKRNRGIVYKSFVMALRGVAAVMILLIATYGVLVAFYLRGEVRVTRNYARELNAPVLAAADELKGWPLYRRAYLEMVGDLPDNVDKCTRLDCPGWKATGEFVAANQRSIALVREASGRPLFGRLVTAKPDEELTAGKRARLPAAAIPEPSASELENPSLIGVLLPDLSVLRTEARWLRADALVAAGGGDAARAAADIEAMLAISDHVMETPFLISDLVAIATSTMTAQLTGGMLADRPATFDEATLARLSHRFAGLNGGRSFRLRLDMERAMFEDFVQRYYTDDGHGDGHLKGNIDLVMSASDAVTMMSGISVNSSAKPLLPIASAVMASRRQLLKRYHELMDLMEKDAALPLWQRGPARAEEALEEMGRSVVERARYLPLTILLPSLSRAAYLMDIATQERDAIEVAIALELYRRAHGSYPQTLAELAPRFIPTVPPDRFDGRPLKYALRDGKPVVYSVGADRDDDGGRLPAGMRPAQAAAKAREWCEPDHVSEALARHSIANGDWVLWPPLRDEQSP
ncbi:MAG: hypothetical protein U1A27_03360 [Phycisphaerae bacterium]